MKIKMIHTTVQEFEVELPDTTDSIVGAMQAANEAHKQGTAKPVNEPQSLGNQVVSIIMMQDEKEVLLLAQQLGQMVLTEEGGLHFNETRDITIARKKQMEEDAQAQKAAEADKPAEDRAN